jgi:ribosomal protein L10
MLEGTFLGAANVGSLARLPDRKVVLAMVIGQIAAPVAGFVGVAAALTGGVVRALHGLAEKRKADAAAAPAPAESGAS